MAHELTEVEINTIKAEIADRQQNLTPALIAEVQRTKAFGDLSENDEYRTAKRELNRNYSRIRYLKGLLENSVLVSYESDADEIGLFDTVTYRDEDMEEDCTVTIVTPLRHDVLNNRISKDSPIGRSLMNHRVGDRVRVNINENNSFMITILDLTKGSDDNSLAIN